MDFGLTADDDSVRTQLAAYLAEHFQPELVQRVGMVNSPERRAFVRKLGEDGWLRMGWPVEYGGTPGSPLLRVIVNEELAYVGSPNIGIELLAVAQTLLRHASSDLVDDLLPGLLRGEILFAYGYTEPEAGSDLASLVTSAVLEGEEFVVNGHKRFITPAHYAHHMFTAVRTDASSKHGGITLLVIPLDTPGIRTEPITTLGEWRTNEVLLDNVRVPKRYLVGEINGGWKILTSALNNERLLPHSPLRRSFQQLVDWARTSEPDGRRPADDPAIRRRLVRLATRLDAALMLFYLQVDAMIAGHNARSEASMNKVFHCEVESEILEESLDLIGAESLIESESDGPAPYGQLLQDYRAAQVNPIAAGSSEVLRNLIANHHLRLPRE